MPFSELRPLFFLSTTPASATKYSPAAPDRDPLSASQPNGPLDTVASPSHRQSWTLDAVGNWTSFSSDGVGQTRTHDLQNGITLLTAPGLVTPGCDANGNTTTDQTGKTFVYDAWDRLARSLRFCRSRLLPQRSPHQQGPAVARCRHPASITRQHQQPPSTSAIPSTRALPIFSP